jgi:hypothetical protein
MTTPPLVFLDIETTSLSWNATIWEVALIRRDPDGTENARRIFVAEPDLLNADPAALAIGRFYDRHPQAHGWKAAQERLNPEGAGGITPPRPVPPRSVSVARADLLPARTVANVVSEWTQGAILIGSNVAFDAHHLHLLLRRHNLVPAWHYRTIDVIAHAAGTLDEDNPALALPWSSYEISRQCGIEPPSDDEAHTARGDARWVQRLWDEVSGSPRPAADAA